MNKGTIGREGDDLPMAAGMVDSSRIIVFEYEKYKAIGLNDLLAFVVYFLEGERYAATFENIAVTSHRMFPAKFSLVGYPNFPDAARVQLVILHLGPKYVGWLEGKKKTGYHLNARGKEAAIRVTNQLDMPQTRSTSSEFAQDNLANRTAVETRIARLRDSASFKQYISGKRYEINDVTLAWEVLGLFITADDLTKAETYRQLGEAAHLQKDREVERFLLWIAKERPYLVGRIAGSKHLQARRRKPRGRS